MEDRRSMVRLLFILLFPLTIFGQRPNGFGGFHHPYVRSITFDHTKVSTSSHTDFPVLISGTYSYLKTVANGGNVLNANGYDIQFYSDAALTTKLKFEQERYVATTGEIQYWVKIPTLSNSSDDVIYMAYGQAGINTDQTDKNNVWNSAYKLVEHQPDGTTLTVLDATSGANNGTINGGTTATTGKVDGGAIFDGTGDYITVANESNFDDVSAITVEGWVWVDVGSSGVWITKSNAGSVADGGWGFDYAGFTAGQIEFFITDGAGGRYLFGGAAMSTGAWHHVAATWDAALSGNTRMKLKIDGVNQTLTYNSNASPSGIAANNTAVTIGAYGNGSGTFAGKTDEVRFSNVVRSDGWILTQYNNQNSPSTFYTISSPL